MYTHNPLLSYSQYYYKYVIHTHTHHRDQCERDKTRSSRVNHGVGRGWEWRGICTVHTYGLASDSGSVPDTATAAQQPFPWQFWLEAVATDRVTDRPCDAIPPHPLPSTPDTPHPFHYRPRLRLCLEKITIKSRMYDVA